MNKLAFAVLLALTICSAHWAFAQPSTAAPHFGLVVHGGAGTITKSSMTPELEKKYRDTLSRAIMTGYNILKNHGTSLDAVEAVIRILEDCPLFNAGKGAVFTHEGTNELDAAIMDGKNLKAGSVASLKHIKNPITLARMVMEKSAHVMLVGDGAESFAKEHGMELVPQSYFFTEHRETIAGCPRTGKARFNQTPLIAGYDRWQARHGGLRRA